MLAKISKMKVLSVDFIAESAIEGAQNNANNIATNVVPKRLPKNLPNLIKPWISQIICE